MRAGICSLLGRGVQGLFDSVGIEVSDEQLLDISKDEYMTECLGGLLIEREPTR